MAQKTELVVALDFPTQTQAEALMTSLAGLPVIYKIGLQLFLQAGPTWVRELTDKGVRVFLDLKFYDIPNTVGQAVLQSAHLGAEFITVHLSGGKTMLDEIDVKLQEANLAGELKRVPKILGVTVLTSFHEEDWIASVSHMAKVSAVRSIEESVLHFANLANDHPVVSGVVCSAGEINSIRSKYPKLFLMVPGIRPKDFANHDQSRVTTPGEASASGASAIVVGRPITQSNIPRDITEQILKEML